MRFFGDIKAFNGIRMGIRNLLINFFAKKNDNTDINLKHQDNDLKIPNGDDYHIIDDQYNILESFKVTNAVPNATVKIVRKYNNYYYVCGDYNTGGSSDIPFVSKFDSNLNLVWNTQINYAGRLSNIFLNGSVIGLILNKVSGNLTAYTLLSDTTGNLLFSVNAGYSDPNYDNGYMRMYTGEPTTTNSGATYTPAVFRQAESGNGAVYIILIDNNSRSTSFFKIIGGPFHPSTQYRQISYYNSNLEQKGNYFGGSFSLRVADSGYLYYRSMLSFVMKINDDDTYDFYSFNWHYRETYSTKYFGYLSSINELGETLGSVTIYSIPDTQFSSNNDTLLYLIPFGVHDHTNITQSWVIEPDVLGTQMSIEKIVHTNDYVHLQVSYTDDGGNPSNGNVVLKKSEMLEKDTIGLGNGFTLVKAENSDVYNYIVNDLNDINELFARDYDKNVAGSTISSNNISFNFDPSFQTYGGNSTNYDYPEDSHFDRTQITVSQTTPLLIEKSDLNDR